MPTSKRSSTACSSDYPLTRNDLAPAGFPPIFTTGADGSADGSAEIGSRYRASGSRKPQSAKRAFRHLECLLQRMIRDLKVKRKGGIKGDPRYGRSRLTNGTELLPNVDSRSTWGRLMRDVIGAMNAHLGGEENVSEPQRMLIRRTAAFEAELVHLEVGFAQARAAGEAPSANSLDLYSRMASGQRRILEACGLHRVARDVTPDLKQYLEMSPDERAEVA